MSRYIDAEKLIDFKFAYITNERYKDGRKKSEEEIYAYKVGYNEAIDNILRFAPTTDVVEVVRCKDCKYFDQAEKYCCDFLTAEEDGFCKWGKRREE